MEPDILAAIEPIIERFETLGVRYQIGGSVASSVYGVARATVDVDMLVELREELVEQLIQGLEADYYVPRERIRAATVRQTSFNIIHLDSMVKIDVFVSTTDAFNRSCLERSRREVLTDASKRPVFVASPEDVVLHKLVWYRKGGESSERQWFDVLGVVRVQGKELDLAYVRAWAAKLGVTDLLSRAIGEAGQGQRGSCS